MKTLVTGGTGFIGSHLVDKLLEQGREVRVLAKPDSEHLYRLEGKPVEIVYGNVRNKKDCKKATENCDIVYHLAAVFGATVKKSEEYQQVNVKGTENMIQASLDKGAKKFICCSSIAAIGAHEKTPIRDDFAYNPMDAYGVSKMEQEQIAFRALEENGLKTSCPRPGMVYGERDDRANTHFFRLIRKRQFPLIGKGEKKLSFVYVQNVVDGILLGEKKQAVGKGYFLTQEPITLKEFSCKIAEEFGVGKPIQIPYWLAYYGIMPFEKIAKLFGHDLPINTRRIKRLTQDTVFSHEKAQKLLGYNPKISQQEGIKKTVKWLKENEK